MGGGPRCPSQRGLHEQNVPPLRKRRTKGLSSFFKFPSCGLKYNADLNGAVNISKRFLDHWLGDRVLEFAPLRGEPSYLPR